MAYVLETTQRDLFQLYFDTRSHVSDERSTQHVVLRREGDSLDLIHSPFFADVQKDRR